MSGYTYYTDCSVYTREALVISGTKTANGIANLEYAFIVTEKGEDPNHYVIPVGAFRSFKDGDGFSEVTSWTNAVKALRMNSKQKSGKFQPSDTDAAPRK